MEYIGPKINQKALNLKWSHYIWKSGSAKMIENEDKTYKYMIKPMMIPRKNE